MAAAGSPAVLELEVMLQMAKTLEGLSPPVRDRVLTWLFGAFRPWG